MQWLVPSVVATMTGTVILTFCYFYLYTQDKQQYLKIWAISWGIYFTRYIFLLAMLLSKKNDWLLIGNQLSTLISGTLLLYGTYLFIEKKFPRPILYLSAIAAVWIFISVLNHFTFMIMSLPTFSFLAAIYIWTGYVFYNHSKSIQKEASILGIGFIAWGIHKANYPFLRPVVWFAPWGYLIAAMLEFITALGLIIVYFRKTKNESQVAEKRYKDLFNSIRDAILVADTERSIVECNPAFTELFGYSISEIKGKKTRYVYENDAQFIELGESLKKHHGNQHVLKTVNYKKKNGEIFPGETGVYYLKNIQSEVVGFIGLIRDISERRKSEETLKKQNYYLERAQDLGEIGTWELDLINNKLVWTDQNCRIFGVPEGSVVDYETFLSKVHPDDRDYVDREWQAGVEGRPYDIEHRLLLDGEVKWVREKADVEFDDNGKAVSAIGFTQDITERKMAEEALYNSNKTLKQAQRVAMIGSWWYNPVTQMPTWTEEMFHIFGLEPQPEALPYEDHRKIIHPNDWDRFDAAVNRAVTDGIGYDLELRITLPSGEIRHVNARCKAEKDAQGIVKRLVGTTQDITARKQAEEALNKERELFKTIIDQIPVMLTRYDPKANMLFLNHEFERLVGWTTEEVQKIDMMEKVYPDPKYRQEAYEYMQKATAEWKEFRVQSKSGAIIESEWSNIRLEDGTQIGIGRDITEKKQLEKKLQQSQKLESIGNLAGGIAHDFNNILSSIIGFTELSLDEAEKDSVLEDNLQEVYAAGKRAKELVNQILAFARQSEVEVKPIQPGIIAKEVLKFIRSSIPTTIVIKQAIESDSFVLGSPTQIYQVVMNLCTNAAHSMEDGGGLMEVSMKDISVPHGFYENSADLKAGDYIHMKVSDTGTGIPSEILYSVFEPYFTTKGPGEGTGMGLAMVQGIIQTYGGAITVDSIPGKGATFNVYLPITKKRTTDDSYRHEELLPGAESILFVDDEASIVKMGKRILEELGYSVETRTSSVEAMELFKSNPKKFDLVISDVTMPNITGDILAKELMAIRPDIPVILCTGYSKKMTDETASEIGIKAFAQKPMEKADLAKTVRQVLDEAKG